MIAELKTAYESGKIALDIAKGMHALKTETAINGAIIDIQRSLLEAQGSLFEANEAYSARLKEIDDLKEEVISLRAWDGEAERYELKRYYPGALAYTLKASMANGQPPHYLCAHCYGKKQKSILQATSRLELRHRVHRCDSCKAEGPIGSEMAATEQA